MLLKTLSILLICLLSSSLASSFLANSQAGLSLATKAIPSALSQAGDQSSYRDASELLTFTDFLTSYNVSAETEEIIITDGKAIKEDGLITHVCSYKIPSKSDPESIFCSLVFFGIDQNLHQSAQIIHLYLNESEQTIFRSQDAMIYYKDVPSDLIFETKSTKNRAMSRCKTDVSYSFINVRTMMPFDYTKDRTADFSVSVALAGGDCDYEITTPLMTAHGQDDDDSDKILPYVGAMVALGLLNILACERLIKRVERNPMASIRASVGSLSMLLIFDFYIYLIHFKAWADDDSDWLAAIFITFFMVSVFFEPALMYYVFSSLKNRRDQRLLDLFYDLYFWVLISGTCLVLSLTCVPNCLYYACPCFLIPQIVDNFKSEKKYRWNLWLIIGLGLPKLVFISYINWMPNNPLQDDADPMVVYVAGGIVLVQLIILGIQTRLPKLGFKLKFLNSYSYVCKAEDMESISTEICSICTESVSETPLIGNTEALLTKKDTSSVMKTPCSHYYHDDCLKEWIRKKLECPNCRQAIPPLEDDEDY